MPSRRNFFFVGIVLALALLVSMAPGAMAVEILYGITFNDELITIDPSTGAGTLVGPLSTHMSAFGLGVWGGKLYTFDQIADLIRELDPATGATLDTIDIGVTTIGEGALTFRSDGIGFLSASAGPNGTLWSFDLTVPSSTQITVADGLNPSMDGLAFDSSDVLYGLAQSSVAPPSALYMIDQVTGATTGIGPPLGVTYYTLGGLDFRSDGTLFAAISNPGSPSSLWTIDKSTGIGALIGPIGFDGVSGLAFLETTSPPPAIPEPSTYALFGLGALAVMVWRWRRTT